MAPTNKGKGHKSPSTVQSHKEKKGHEAMSLRRRLSVCSLCPARLGRSAERPVLSVPLPSLSRQARPAKSAQSPSVSWHTEHSLAGNRLWQAGRQEEKVTRRAGSKQPLFPVPVSEQAAACLKALPSAPARQSGQVRSSTGHIVAPAWEWHKSRHRRQPQAEGMVCPVCLSKTTLEAQPLGGQSPCWE